jgi:vitamin B12/bleomycin/antimicrobial peptide transport system ATP-binding/permease protein
MNQHLTAIAAKRSFFGKLWSLTWPYFTSGDWRVANALLVVVLSMNFGLVYVSVLFTEWNRDFFNALEAKNGGAFAGLIWHWLMLVAIYLVIAVYNLYLRQMLHIRWRRWLTEGYIGAWLDDRVYYRMELTGSGADNPEQRIEADIDQFTGNTIYFAVNILTTSVSLVTFTFILWTLSGFYELEIVGIKVTIPGYLFWVALLYAFGGTILTHFLGRALARINFVLQKLNADFRFRMSRLREHAESIAFFHGDAAERAQLSQAFGFIWRKWRELMNVTARLTFFTALYDNVSDIVPLILQAPRYFSGAITLGELTQAASVFGRVQGALSWFIRFYDDLVEWKAAVDRLTELADAIVANRQIKSELEVTTNLADEITAERVNIKLPDGSVLIAGERLLITCPSGSGKTTIFRALAGIWPFGKGRIRMPAQARMLFLPQRPYLPVGRLSDALAYPGRTEDFTAQELGQVLDDVNLPHLRQRLDETANWSLALSMGEQQRVAIARALLLRPDWLFLDEATSALDAANEARLYALLDQRLPKAAILSIAHHPDISRYHAKRLVIDPATRTAALAQIPA